MTVTFFKTPSGRSPVLEYIHELAKPERARVFEALDQIERHGFDAIRVQFRQVEGKLWEIKVSSQRILYVVIEREELVCCTLIRNRGKSYRSTSETLPLDE